MPNTKATGVAYSDPQFDSVSVTGSIYAGQGVYTPTYTYATLPAASSVAAGTQFWTSDQGMVVSNGTSWKSVTGTINGLYNFSPQNYKNTRKALANVRLGVSRMNVLCLGDSITVGFIGATAADRKGSPARERQLRLALRTWDQGGPFVRVETSESLPRAGACSLQDR